MIPAPVFASIYDFISRITMKPNNALPHNYMVDKAGLRPYSAA